MSKKDFSSYKLFVYLTFGIFATELFIMFSLRYLSLHEISYIDFIDSFFLIAIVSPLVYILTVRPLQSKIIELEKAGVVVEKYTSEIEVERRAIYDAIENSIIVSITDEKGDIIYANQKFIDISKYSQEELLGQNHRILKSGHQPQEMFVEMWATISSGKIWRGEIKNRAKDGGYYWVDAIIAPVLGSDGKPKKYIATRVVITERKNAEKKLREYLKKIELLKATSDAFLASIGEGLITTDKTGKIIEVNPSTEKMLGWRKEELVGKQMTEIIIGLDENDEIIPQEKRSVTVALATGKETPTIAKQYIAKDGKYVPVAGTINPVILDNELIGAIAVFRDTTREAEIERTRRDILSIASHQLRTPLSGTKWLIETLKKGVNGTLTKKQEEYLDQIYKINERMTTLVHDMLSVLRIESDIAQPKKERVSSSMLFDVLFETQSDVAKSKHIILRLQKNEEYIIETNRIMLRNILENLISNAINYSPKGGEVIVSIEKKSNELVFAVKDFGIGIPKNERAQIFKRFYRASNAKTFDTRGTGLGLYIVATLAEKIGARISFESEERKGSTFYVHIPYNAIEGLPQNSTSV
ncbi:MAG: PAS domain S-box protein [Candidatus Yonathbacteria bacterium]|nr:PAS domain S-box protein [Candidatus Yonathbacteria bacterium]